MLVREELVRAAREHAFRNSLGQGVYLVDEQGLLTELNPAAEELLGWSTDELRGRNMHEAVHFRAPDGTPVAKEDCPLLGVLRSGVDYAAEDDVFVRKDGSDLRVAYLSTPVLVDEAVVGGVLAFWPR